MVGCIGMQTAEGVAAGLQPSEKRKRNKNNKKKKRKRLLLQSEKAEVVRQQHGGQDPAAAMRDADEEGRQRPTKKRRKKVITPKAAPNTGHIAAAGHADKDPGSTGSDALVPPSPLPLPSWPFQPHPADHCETPLAAYRDLAPLLQGLASALHGATGTAEGGSHANDAEAAAAAARSKLRIYDPYFCTGRVREHLGSLGFPQVMGRGHWLAAGLGVRSVMLAWRGAAGSSSAASL